jgi:NAD+-dependent protein deacetylase sirtuin 6
MSSLGYAERLAWKDDVGGTLGERELFESDEQVVKLSMKLALLIERSGTIFNDNNDDNNNNKDDKVKVKAEDDDDDDEKKKKKKRPTRRKKNTKQCKDEEKRCGIIVHTGAGISTSSGIPDFRGPNGIWTLQKQGKPLPTSSVPFPLAAPTATHMVLVALQKAGYVRYLVSCNVDGLHYRSGYPREECGELHGNCFAERCERCETEFFRDFEMESVGFKYTGRNCSNCSRSSGKLRDQVLDWDDALPELELSRAERDAKKSNLALVLGSSLQIIPSGDLPLLTLPDDRYMIKKKKKKSVNTKKRKKTTASSNDDAADGKLVIVNLQKTEKDQFADLVIHAKTDVVMLLLAKHLELKIPEYVRKDAFKVLYNATTTTVNTSSSSRKWFLTIEIVSQYFVVAGTNVVPIPWLEDVYNVSIPNWINVEDGETKYTENHNLFCSKKFKLMREDILNKVHDDDNDLKCCVTFSLKSRMSATMITEKRECHRASAYQRIIKELESSKNEINDEEIIDGIITQKVQY